MLGSALFVRTAVTSKRPERVRIEILDRFKHDEGWWATGLGRYRWAENRLCSFDVIRIEDRIKSPRNLDWVIRRWSKLCPGWDEGHLWVTKDLTTPDEKVFPGSFSLLPHYARVEALLYRVAEQFRLGPAPDRDLRWSMIDRFGGFRRYQHNDWSRNMR